MNDKFLEKLPFFLLFVFALVFVFAILPAFVLAAEGIVPCGRGGSECSFADLAKLINSMINFLTLKLAVPLATASIAVAGIMYVTAAGSQGQVDKAKDIIYYAAWGLVLSLAAYLIITTILDFLAKGGKGILNTA